MKTDKTVTIDGEDYNVYYSPVGSYFYIYKVVPGTSIHWPQEISL